MDAELAFYLVFVARRDMIGQIEITFSLAVVTEMEVTGGETIVSVEVEQPLVVADLAVGVMVAGSPIFQAFEVG